MAGAVTTAPQTRPADPERSLLPAKIGLANRGHFRTPAYRPFACDHQTGQAVRFRRHYCGIPGSTRAPGTENPQGTPPATPSTHREPYIFHHARTRAPSREGPR